MILVDPRAGSRELLPLIRRCGVEADLASPELEYGDACFEGQGPAGTVMIGVERKTLHEMLSRIDDARYNLQRIGMRRMYSQSILMLEGHWRPRGDGMLMQGFPDSKSWIECRYRSQPTRYAKLYRYLLSVRMSGVLVDYTRGPWHTAYNIVECYHYWQKRWEDHTALLQTQKFALPDMNGKPSLTRKWAADLTDIGVKFSMEAEQLFRTPLALAESTTEDWVKVRGIGLKTAAQIIREIRTGRVK